MCIRHDALRMRSRLHLTACDDEHTNRSRVFPTELSFELRFLRDSVGEGGFIWSSKSSRSQRY